MKVDLSYPYVKVYQDGKNRVRYVARKNQDTAVMMKQDTVGNLLIDFVLLDLAEYKERITTLLESVAADFTVDNELTFAIYNAEIYETAKLLNNPHPI